MFLTLSFSVLGYRLATVDLDVDVPDSAEVKPVEHVAANLFKKFSRACFNGMTS